MITEITPEAPQASSASLPTLDPIQAKRLRRLAASYRSKQGFEHMASVGHVIVYADGAVGWSSALKWPESWVPGCFAVPADDGPIYFATGGTAAHGAKKWEAIS